ncbi:MAG TPA: hypothetical protein VM537_12905 [Anaerolineae bacterium]|nr:hypothetical protein [Anaerolineae bacterium]
MSAMTLAERFLTRLHGVRASGTGWTACCPAHDDSEPSLSISQKNGRVLLHCFAGCSNEDIVAALGLTTGDLFEGRRPKAQASEIVATYDYTDETAGLLYQVARYRPKGFKQRRPDGNGGWLWNMKGVRRVLYRLPQVLEAAARGGRVHIAAGEKDVAAVEFGRDFTGIELDPEGFATAEARIRAAEGGGAVTRLHSHQSAPALHPCTLRHPDSASYAGHSTEVRLWARRRGRLQWARLYGRMMREDPKPSSAVDGLAGSIEAQLDVGLGVLA